MARFVNFPATIETERGQTIEWLKLDSVKGFHLWHKESTDYVDVYFVDGDSYHGVKQDINPFVDLIEEQRRP
jgi:hypothetical protein